MNSIKIRFRAKIITISVKRNIDARIFTIFDKGNNRDFSGVLVVTSAKSLPTLNLVPGVTGLNFLIPLFYNLDFHL